MPPGFRHAALEALTGAFAALPTSATRPIGVTSRLDGIERRLDKVSEQLDEVQGDVAVLTELICSARGSATAPG